MYSALIYAISIIVIGILVIHKNVTLAILNNMTFKWIFERKQTDNAKKQEVGFSIKDFKGLEQKDHLGYLVGIGIVLLGALMLIIVGVSWLFAPFIQVAEIDSRIYMDAPTIGRNLIVFEAVTTGFFSIGVILLSLKWSNDRYEAKIFQKKQKN